MTYRFSTWEGGSPSAGPPFRQAWLELLTEPLRRLEEDVVRLGLSDRDPHALARERPDHPPRLLARLCELDRAFPQPQPHEVGLGLRHRPALGAQRVDHAGA